VCWPLCPPWARGPKTPRSNGGPRSGHCRNHPPNPLHSIFRGSQPSIRSRDRCRSEDFHEDRSPFPLKPLVWCSISPFQVTHVSARPPTGMLRFELVRRKNRAPASSLPTTALGRLRLNAPRLACLSLPLGASVSQRPFAHPQRLSPFRRTATVRSPFPAYRFHRRTESYPDPFGAVLPTPGWSFSPSRARSTPDTRCPEPSPVLAILPQALAPLRDFRPSGS
jgi:hypothetical protein